MPAPVRFNWYFMSLLTFEAVSGRMVGRRCGWRSYVYGPRRPRKISPLHSLGHPLTMEARSTLRKPCTAISLFFEVQRHSAVSYNSYMASHSQKSLLLQHSIFAVQCDYDGGHSPHHLCTPCAYCNPPAVL